MSSNLTTLPVISPAQFAQRLAANFPTGWSSQEAKYTVDGVLFNVLQMIGTELNFELDTSLAYAMDATRLQTATDGALDLASLDFFGPAPTSPFALPRLSGEGDPAFLARIEDALLPTGDTRTALFNAIEAATGFAPRLIEPWSPADTGVWDGGAGAGMMFWDVDTEETPFRWTDQNLNYQGFAECILPLTEPFGDNPTPCYDVSTGFYWDLPNQHGAWLIDPEPPISGGEDAVYNVINRTKVFGTIVWVKFVSPRPGPPPTYLTNDSGVLVITSRYNTQFPVSPIGLSAGDLWCNCGPMDVIGVVCVVPTTTPDPSAPPVFYLNLTASVLLVTGGANLPLTNPGAGSGQLWNNAGVVCVA